MGVCEDKLNSIITKIDTLQSEVTNIKNNVSALYVRLGIDYFTSENKIMYHMLNNTQINARASTSALGVLDDTTHEISAYDTIYQMFVDDPITTNSSQTVDLTTLEFQVNSLYSDSSNIFNRISTLRYQLNTLADVVGLPSVKVEPI